MRVIDADFIIQKLTDFGAEKAELDRDLYLLGGVIAIVDNAPTINLNRQGKWLEINHTCGYMRTCSECGWSTDTQWMPGSLENEKFCPNCGAEMGGAE